MNKPAPVHPSLFLREPELRRGLELLMTAQRSFAAAADDFLEENGLGRAHHQALYYIARAPGLTMGDLMDRTAVAKQSLHRTMTELLNRGLVEQASGLKDRRQRLLRLTAAGANLEAAATRRLQERMADAYLKAGPEAVGGFWAVLLELLSAEERARINPVR